ncbi:MAG TPA: YebC/PmpR family DNA-binding transcriptional regulator [Pirellulales bacterium]|nr:YebC/PmpR family DNA-binding transcriptional regulator [Pirellulales bacterium]
MTVFSIPAQVALALIAVIGYFIGRRGRKQSELEAERARLELKRAKAVAADMYLRLHYAIDVAKAAGKPKENVRPTGTNEPDASNFEEILYEGYGPGGVAVLCEIRTDNRNRTAGEIRKIFELADGQLGATGSVAWMFSRKGLILVAADKVEEDELLELALEAGADDVKRVEDNFEITCEPTALNQVSGALEKHGIPVDVKEIGRIPTSSVDLDAQTAAKVLELLERLDDHNDVKSVASNFNIPLEALAEEKS